MAREVFALENTDIYTWLKVLESQEYVGEAINDVLWNEGAPLIQESIQRLLPESGRTWRGKKPAAKRAAPFTQQNETLAVTVKTKNAYHYLYFPDDGSTTRKHVGNQQFMLRGAEEQQSEIISRCIARLTEFER